MTNPAQPDPIRLQEIDTRNRDARHTVAGLSSALPTLTEIWRHLDQALTDTATLVGEIARQRADVAALRLDRANLLAAMLATLAAHRDDEPDPLFYLHDELRVRDSTRPDNREPR